MMGGPFAYIVALVVLLCFLAAAITAIVIREGNLTAASPMVTTLLGLFGPTIALLVILVRQQHNIDTIQQVQQQVNGHLQETVKAAQDASAAPKPPAS